MPALVGLCVLFFLIVFELKFIGNIFNEYKKWLFIKQQTNKAKKAIIDNFFLANFLSKALNGDETA